MEASYPSNKFSITLIQSNNTHTISKYENANHTHIYAKLQNTEEVLIFNM